MATHRAGFTLLAAACLTAVAAACGGGSTTTTVQRGGGTSGTSATTIPVVTAAPGAPAPRSDFTKVVGNGQHYSFPTVVDSSQYPPVCSVLPMASIQALLAGPVTSSVSDQNECKWVQSGVSSLNQFQLSFTIDNVSTQSATDYQSAQQTDGSNNAMPVPGVGQQAFVYTLTTQMPEPRIYVLTSQVDFDVALIPPGESTITLQQADAIVIAAAKAIAPEFS